MDSESLDRAWDPAAPGAGALRSTAIAQLYFRMTSHHPLTILIVDAMCLTFGADGATVQELVDYLGITEDRIRFGLESIPSEMRCTSQQLESEGVTPSVVDASAAYDTRTPSNGPASENDPPGDRRVEKEGRYFLNYKRLLPLVYAHVTRLLLATCVVDVPACSYVEAVKAAQLAPYSRTSDSTAHAFFASSQPPARTGSATNGGQRPAEKLTTTAAAAGLFGSSFSNTDSTGEHIDVSDAMKRKSAIRGMYCLGCSCYFLVEEFNDTLSRCPRCGKDSLRLCIQSIQRQLNARIAAQHTVVKLLPAVSQIWKKSVSTLLASTKQPQPQQTASGEGNAMPTTASATAAQQNLNCALANDPFLFQQALAFLHLYAARFASVNDAASVVDVQQILTEPEYRERLRGKASLADQFRSRHRHATSVHVRLVSQSDVDAARRAESHQKLLKRAMLPPWLRHTSTLETLGGSHVYTRNSAAMAEGEMGDGNTDSGDGVRGAGPQEPWESEVVQTSDHTKAPPLHSGAVWKTGKTQAAATVGDKRRRPAEVDTRADLLRTADFIAKHYYEDEYDEVTLPSSRMRRHHR
ncbi:hypothetical protein ABB37_01128 [Leptomonas pyrrhocoris]|uniref:TFIIH basal transcription factor subunit n=1 Tax=Leptomonas pyrrhocoris TaxID=157538 RepID=A0A0M9G800_LEPPY|nr:hypothetical protein ABB37_01128 [Leptomonas pyrrhocoris]KPA84600.1 hypothetical protein ABB37_01128 [Leptomonas pyrrhocoris]|eukprot:XP_015663039.1 hypothetical protein ABB37_01128 [Leptomonas pyrrhocoris]